MRDKDTAPAKGDSLTEIGGCIVAIAAIMIVTSFVGNGGSQKASAAVHPRAATSVVTTSETDAATYEALRDAAAQEPSLAPRLRRALADGMIDQHEADALSYDLPAMRPSTTMTAQAAKRDLVDTLEALESRK